MTTSNPREPGAAGVSALLAVALATISYFALALFGLGAVSSATDADIISVPGLGQVPGASGMLFAIAVFAVTLWTALRREHPSFLSVPTIALATALTHLSVVWIAVLIGTGDLITATAVASDLVRGWSSAVILAAAAIAAWGGVALRRTKAQHPQWPWERDDDE